jgi:hypothetical protein
MYRSAVVFGLYLSFAIAVGAACSNGGGPQLPSDVGSYTPGSGGGGGTAGGATNTGGSTNTGGTTGGSTNTGGTTGGSFGTGGTGGTTATGGTGGTSVAGRSNTGGSTTTGGTGGSTATGGSGGRASGTGGTGGSTATGGTTSGGGMASTTGGTTSAGGSGSGGVMCDTAFTVGMDGFVRMPAKDGSCWHGYAYASGDTATTIQYCNSSTATGFSMCMGMLSISGTVTASTSTNNYAGYVLIGFSTSEAAGGGTKGTVTPTGTGLVVTGTAASGRVQIQNGKTYYCANFTSGMVVPYTMFNTKCYDSPPDGDAYKTTIPIDTIALEIPGGAMDAKYSISLASVKEM